MWVKINLQKTIVLLLGLLVGMLLSHSAMASAAGLIPIAEPTPVSNSYGLEATKTQPPPTQAATITVPGSGASYSTSPVTVSGICPAGLLVQVYDNGVMVGAINCSGNSYSIQVSLFTGQNVLTTYDYDDLGQAGPVSNSVTVNYNNLHLTSFGQLVTLTSDYGRRAANTGTDLSWPLLLSGGTGPYAFSINWGDNSPSQLLSQALSGTVTINHTYKNAGIYHVTVQVVDHNGVSAFLQLVAVSNGNISASQNNGNGASSNSPGKAENTTVKVMWVPSVVGVALLAPTYWLGRKSELVALRKKLEKDMKSYKGE
jgi:hypothetical protein